ncbi:HupE/UreJ family protein [Sphingomonas sp. MMS24-J13]|uniref:HupE/UreJ family protein n=1 Tax=Sphingomonas sp. MMS24-J13 TaxID=3238686 RepID=UPI00384E9121
MPSLRSSLPTLLRCLILLSLLAADQAIAHAIGGRDAAFVAATRGPAPGPFLYLGAKHMVTGYDHLLFLAGVVFFLRRFRDVLIYVSLFSLGHSSTLLSGALFGFGLNSWLVDAVIGLSVAWKAFDNLGGFETLVGRRPDPKLMVLLFGLIHGLGLATKLEALKLHREGLVINLLSFNLGVEIGQIVALAIVLALIAGLRRTALFARTAVALNWAIMTSGFVLIGTQLAGYTIAEGY